MKPTITIIGGGIAGLSCATYLGRAGFDVIVLERSRHLGGRAATQTRHDFDFNLGPHALYVKGAGSEVLRELGVSFRGKVPSASSSYGLHGGKLRTLPMGFVSMLVSGLLSVSGKLQAAKFLARINKLDPAEHAGTSAAGWLAEQGPADARELLAALFRVTTYVADHELLDAGAALRNLQLAVQAGVYYLDDGWQVLVDGLREAAVNAGARIVTGAAVTEVARDAGGWRVTTRTEVSHADYVVIAATPAVAAQLVPASATLQAWARQARPTYVATLDVALGATPRPARKGRKLILGIDEPYYLSVHSDTAALAPAGGDLIHVVKYTASEQPAAELRGELERLLDLGHPGWRERLVHARFLPHLIVAADTPRGPLGLAGRAGPAVADAPGLWVAGDWVGGEGMLADAAFASAREAAALVIAAVNQRTAGAVLRTSLDSARSFADREHDASDPALPERASP